VLAVRDPGEFQGSVKALLSRRIDTGYMKSLGKLIRYGAASAIEAAFGSLWITQHVLLDRVLFRHDHEMAIAETAHELST
jgi:hypothetical protein